MKIILSLIALIGLGAVVGAVVVGSMSFEGTVVEKPYEAGITWDTERKNQERLGWNMDVGKHTFIEGNNNFDLMIRDKKGMPLKVSGSISLSAERPSNNNFHIEALIKPIPDGTFSANLTLPSFGLWDLNAAIEHNGERLNITRRINAEGVK
ncbi:FixH family protein [Nitrospirota bacterium]